MRRKQQVATTDSMREVVLKLFDKGCNATEISNVLEISYTSIKRIIDAIETARSKDPEIIKAYKDSYSYTEPNWNWAKAKFNIVESEEPEEPEEECNTCFDIPTLVKQNEILLVETRLLRELLEGELKKVNTALTTILECWGADTEDRKNDG